MALLAVGLAAVGSGCARGDFVPLRVGQCLPDGAGVEGRRAQDPQRVSCAEPHRYQVFAIETLEPPSDDWPGDDVVSAHAERLCVDAIEPVTGVEPAKTPDDVQLLHVDPTPQSWREGDRDVECIFRWDDPTTDTLVR